MSVSSVLVERMAAELMERHAVVTTAESCTGGWIAKILTDVPGSSAWFEYGFVSYGDNAKADLLNVDSELIKEHGAVSEKVAIAMVAGALDRSGATYGMAVTGIAGPEGGTADKPVGTVWFAWGGEDRVTETLCKHFEGDRDTVRRQTVTTALTGMLEFVQNNG
ncbi:MAG: nicotinamide-nucleotide amidohydrolase family protein [Gammaproteobacteria bacterium]|jgi:nicotinamide-nucleotide amidase|nr:nicotinamide-nucleotide amidohydrolase family protein [Gammaproteobacteria bacterium]MDP6615548.1 nicotinamide-nucleotide amidohydrolase family protein [Gammaproteobacteria bacterium]MDP6694778.1 nicotinamide-nucleotide amidohydrolase family protein [Gammaproteobacteria bacterium]